MKEDPPDLADLNASNNKDLETILMNREEILLEPNGEEEIAVFNAAICQDSQNWPLPFIYRAVKKDNVSVIKYRKLISPTKLSRYSKVLIQPTEPYEKVGCEDPRITRIRDEFYITYSAFDGKNVRIALARTKDFRAIEKLGVIGPQIDIKEAIGLVGDKKYKETWKRSWVLNGDGWLLPDKDASLHFKDGKWVLIHRLEPDMHIAYADSLEEFRSQRYWRDYIRNLNRHVLMRAEEKWEEEKIGLGCLNNIDGRFIGTYHGVDSNLNYYGSFFEVRWDDGKIAVKSKLRNPILKPDSEICFFKPSENERPKRVVFPTSLLAEKNNDIIWITYGVGDRMIGIMPTNKGGLFEKLDHPSNRYYN